LSNSTVSTAQVSPPNFSGATTAIVTTIRARFARSRAGGSIQTALSPIWPAAGGYDFVRDPDIPAAHEPAIWLPEHSPGTLILATAPPGFAANALEPGALGPLLADRSDADGRHVVIGDTSGGLHIWLKQTEAAQRPAVLLPVDDACELRLEIALRFIRRLRGQNIDLFPRLLRITSQHRARLTQLLHAHDIYRDGGGPREVAIDVFDSAQASLPSSEWKDSSARRKANRLIQDSIALVNRGYLKLLRGE